MTRQQLLQGDNEEFEGKKGRAQEIDHHIGKRLRKMRKMRNLTQEDLAERLGVTFQQIQKYENGKNRIPFARAYEISNFLGVDLDAFLDGVQNSVSPGMADNKQADFVRDEPKDMANVERDTEELQKAYFSIKSPERRKAFVKLVKDMAKTMQD